MNFLRLIVEKYDLSKLEYFDNFELENLFKEIGIGFDFFNFEKITKNHKIEINQETGFQKVRF